MKLTCIDQSYQDGDFSVLQIADVTSDQYILIICIENNNIRLCIEAIHHIAIFASVFRVH